MKSYDYNLAFSPYEFQNFARDIVQIKEHMMFESFAEGRDCGIDGRNVAEDGYTTILQAKQNINMSSQILRIMKREKEKMDHLVHVGKRVDRYVLVLSDDIGPEKKEKIIQIMFPYIKVPGDIIDRKDINNLLGMPEYKTIEGNYY